MMRTILILLAAALPGCAVYNTPYVYSAVPVYAQPPVVYQDPWPVRVLVPQPVAQPPQPSVIYEDNRQFHYYGHTHKPVPKKKP